jgi:hypothetical protein
VDIHQYIPRTLVNWQNSGGHSPIYLLNIRFAEHTAVFDPFLNDSTPSDSIAIAQFDYR